MDAWLERLVAQFASPYDFLRELVQNALDAGADRVEVTLEAHPTEDPDTCIYELTIMDTGAGMDEEIIDEELTRLFGTSKAGDLSTAGGFGVGFVSVFAWRPDAVLLQTGREGEAWELLFHPDRTFEKVAVDAPLEGTVVWLLRRGRPDEGPRIAEGVRAALWRWCRYAPLELTFEDLDAGEGPELVQDSPLPPDTDLRLRLEDGPTRIELAFDAPPHAVLLRRGLILQEGAVEAVLPEAAATLGDAARHLRLWVDSPLLRTTLAREGVRAGEGQAEVESMVLGGLSSLRTTLLDTLEATAGAAPWGAERHDRYAHLHAHLALERDHLPSGWRGRPILAGASGPLAVDDLAERRVLLLRAPDPIPSDAGASRPAEAAAGPPWTELAAAFGPALWARPEDLTWLRPLLELHGARGVWPEEAGAHLTPEAHPRLLSDVSVLLEAAGHTPLPMAVGRIEGASGDETLLGWSPGADVPFALSTALHRRDGVIWWNSRHPTWVAACKVHDADPATAALACALALLAELATEASPLEDVTDALLDAADARTTQGGGAS